MPWNHNVLFRFLRRRRRKEGAQALPAVCFNGSDAWAGYDGNVFPGGSLTLSFWMRLGGAPSSGTLPIMWGRDVWSVALQNVGIRTYNHSGGARLAVWSYPSYGEWHHYLLTYSVTNGWRCWIDGVSQSAASSSGTLVAMGSDAWMSLNAYSATTFPAASNLDWQFDLHEWGMWSAELSAADATEHYNSGTPLDLDAAAAGPSMLHRWRFRDASTVLDTVADADLTLTNCELISDAFSAPDGWEAVTLGGQSLAVGETGTTSPLNLHPPVNTYPINDDGSLVIRAHDGYERPEIAMAYTLTYLRSSKRFVIQNIAVNGTAYSGLKKGTTPYNNGITGLGTMATATATRGRQDALRHIAFPIIHGESDEIAGSSTYDDDLAEWQSDWDGDARAAVGQGDAIPLVQSQMSRLPSYPGVANIALQQWTATQANPGKIYLVGPKYQYTYVDTYHLNAASSAAMGAKYGQVLAAIAAGDGWTPLSPASITGAGTDTIVLTLNVPAPPVVFDTTTLSAVADYGFEVSDDGGASISSVVLTDAAGVITITLNQALTTNPRLRYVYTAASAAAYHGNVRDSDSTDLGPHTSPQPNWLIHFDEVVT